ncbi:Uncharacterized protein QTN25_008442 [Entamoeba marina]
MSENQEIIRHHPFFKNEEQYPNRYPEDVFIKFNEMCKNTQLMKDYQKWKSGINYKTNRKVTIGGKVHNRVKDKFMIHYEHHCQSHTSMQSILFEKVNDIDKDQYLSETEQINKGVDIKNLEIDKYNASVKQVIAEIEKLTNWNDYILFNQKKYGICEKVKNNVHVENNCGGSMIFSHEKKGYIFRDRPFCNNYSDIEITYSCYKCDKCGFENKI